MSDVDKVADAGTCGAFVWGHSHGGDSGMVMTVSFGVSDVGESEMVIMSSLGISDEEFGAAVAARRVPVAPPAVLAWSVVMVTFFLILIGLPEMLDLPQDLEVLSDDGVDVVLVPPFFSMPFLPEVLPPELVLTAALLEAPSLSEVFRESAGT